MFQGSLGQLRTWQNVICVNCPPLYFMMHNLGHYGPEFCHL